MDQGLLAVMASVEITPESGNPPPMPLPTVMMSGTTPSCSEAHMAPLRPNPVSISSTIKSAPCSRAIAWTARRKPSGGTTLPAVPWTGSTMIAPTSPAVWYRMTSRTNSAHAMPQSG